MMFDPGPSLAEASECLRRDPEGIQMLKAVLTDSHFWIPVVVLILGIALLVYLR
jgi:hypothetical protein